MLARDSEVLADDSRHVSFEALAIYTDPTTRKSVANAARYAYTREHKPWIVTFTRDHDLAKSRMIDDLRGPKRLLAQRGPKRLLAQRWPAAGNLGSRPVRRSAAAGAAHSPGRGPHRAHLRAGAVLVRDPGGIRRLALPGEPAFPAAADAPTQHD